MYMHPAFNKVNISEEDVAIKAVVLQKLFFFMEILFIDL